MKKIPTLFVRDPADRKFVTQEVTPGCEWVLAGDGVATRKWDGTCVMVDADRSLWARREVKRGGQEPNGFRPIDTDAVTGKTVGWEPAEQSSFGKLIVASYAAQTPGTYELVGPKVNGNPDNFKEHRLVRHGILAVTLNPEERSYDGLVKMLTGLPMFEGFVFWRVEQNQGAGMAKIKRRDFRELAS